MILSFAHGSEFASGGQMKADQWARPLTQIETLFQSRVRGANFEGESIHGNCFRKHGLTQVFRRKNAGDIFTAQTGRSPGVRDVPGGALRFRLRAHADVMVFFTASILRTNHWDESLKSATHGAGPPTLSSKGGLGSLEPYNWSHIGFRAYWEGGTREPGSELVQAQSYMAQQASFIDKVDVGRQVFLCYRILPQDVGPHVTNTDTEENNLMYAGLDTVNPESPSDLRMVDSSAAITTGGPYGSEDVGRLLPGWHNIRHTFHHAREADFDGDGLDLDGDGLDLDLGGKKGIRATPEPLVFGNTELVVVADYGPRSSSLTDAILEGGLGDREEADSTRSSVGKFEADR